MKKYIFLSLGLLLAVSVRKSNAQSPVAQLIDSLSKTITPFYSDKVMLQIDNIHVRIRVLQNLTAADTILTFNLNAGNFPNSPKLIDSSIVIPADKRSANSIFDTTLVLSTRNMPDTLQQDEFGTLRIGSNSEYVTIRLSSRDTYDPQKPFWIELGANLDLIDGVKANNLFSGVFVYKRDIRPLCGHNHTPNVGIFGGVFESKTVTSRSDLPSTSFAYRSTDSFSPIADSGYIFKDTGEVKVNQEVRNVGLFISPQIKLSNGSSNRDGLHFFISLWAEMQWQRITNSYDYSGLRRIDTVRVFLADLEKYDPLKKTSSVDLYTHYEGIGLPIFFKYKEVNLFFNAVIGGSNQVSSDQLKFSGDLQQMNDMPRYWKLFYAMQFRLNEEQYGFAMSGEVRGVIPKNNKPFVTLVLSKKFDLAKLIEFK